MPYRMNLNLDITPGMENEVLRRYVAAQNEAPIVNYLQFHLFQAHKLASELHNMNLNKTAHPSELAIMAALAARHMEQATHHLSIQWRD